MVVSTLTVLASAAIQAPIPWDALAWTFPLWVVAPLAAVGLVGPGPATRRENRYLERLDREAGAVGAEYAGGIVIVVLVIGSLLMGFGAGGPVSEQIKYVICQALTFGQGGCQAPGTSSSAEGVDPRAPTEPCVVMTTRDTRDVGLTVVSVDISAGGTIMVETMSDGTYRVSEFGSAGAGVSVGVGGGVSVTIDDNTYGGVAMAGVGAQGIGELGQTWIVDADEKDRLVEYLTTGRDRLAMSMAGPVGAIFAGGGALGDLLFGDGYDPGPADEIHAEIRVEGSGSAQATGGTINGLAEAELAIALGSTVNVTDGSVTVYYKVSGEGGIGLSIAPDGTGMGVVGEASAEGSAEMVVAVTYDGDETPVRIAISTQAVGEWEAGVAELYTGRDLTAPGGNGGRAYNATVDLTSEEATAIGLDLLDASGILPHSRDAVRQYESARDAYDRFMAAARERGVITRQDLTTGSTTPFAFQAELAELIEFGGSYTDSTSTVTSTGAQYYSDDLWKDWVECA